MNSNLSQVLKERRAALGLTLKQVADAVGVTEATVQRWEKTGMNIRYEKATLLAEVLHVDAAVLFGWGSKKESSPRTEEQSLTPKQLDLIEQVRHLSDSQVDAILTLLRAQADL